MVLPGYADTVDVLGYLIERCNDCEQRSVFTVLEARRRLTLAMIPTPVNINQQRVMECRTCGARFGVPRSWGVDLSDRLMTQGQLSARIRELNTQSAAGMAAHFQQQMGSFRQWGQWPPDGLPGPAGRPIGRSGCDRGGVQAVGAQVAPGSQRRARSPAPDARVDVGPGPAFQPRPAAAIRSLPGDLPARQCVPARCGPRQPFAPRTGQNCAGAAPTSGAAASSPGPNAAGTPPD